MKTTDVFSTGYNNESRVSSLDLLKRRKNMCLVGTLTIRADDSSFFFFFLCNSPQIQSGSKGLLSYPRSKLKRLSVRDYGLSSMNFKSASKEKHVH